MKSSLVFALIFIAFFITFGYGEDEFIGTSSDSDVTTVAGITKEDTVGPTTDNSGQTEGITANSANTDSPNTGGPTNAPATGETNAPQSTVPSDNTAAPPTTAAAAPTCPDSSIFGIKDDGNELSWSETIPAGIECTYFARSSSFSKSIVIDQGDSLSLDGSTLKISDNSGNTLYDSSTSSTFNTIHSKASQVIINVNTQSASGEAKVSLKFKLEEDLCNGNPCNTGTCAVIQGQETCTCTGCYTGARCEIKIDPCATYQLVCHAQSKNCVADDQSCTAQCT